jgi:hypothetical protein
MGGAADLDGTSLGIRGFPMRFVVRFDAVTTVEPEAEIDEAARQ